MTHIVLNPAFAERSKEPGAGVFYPASAPPSGGALRRFLGNPAALTGILILAVIGLIAIFGPLLRPGDPLMITGEPLIRPLTDAAHPFGTDVLGRDLLSGVLHGARVSLTIGLTVALLSLVFGALVGAVAGYAGGWVDALISRAIEVFQTIPGFVLLVVLVSVLEPSYVTIIIGLTLISWDAVARLTRAEVRSHRSREYVLAAETSGYSSARILFREILPNIAPTLIVTGSIIVASAILSESALSFLGLGDPNAASWGSLIGSGREQIRSHWYPTVIPGLFIMATVFALNILGDALNDHLNPRGSDGT
ncbi:ABC transporter permease [Mesorhizobium sp. DCY119]|uniref:ABC transporter permease n=1 Tax=Mesorhizobium sp. DCY119 TaxID=2108445 RepID=UPI0018D4E908|nr:ABC transporter permease [Mesorhizobium sp. DCY119]